MHKLPRRESPSVKGKPQFPFSMLQQFRFCHWWAENDLVLKYSKTTINPHSRTKSIANQDSVLNSGFAFCPPL
jgi:hypothetical protein